MTRRHFQHSHDRRRLRRCSLEHGRAKDAPHDGKSTRIFGSLLEIKFHVSARVRTRGIYQPELMTVAADTPAGALFNRSANGRSPERVEVVCPQPDGQAYIRREPATVRDVEAKQMHDWGDGLVVHRPRAGCRSQGATLEPPPRGKLTVCRSAGLPAHAPR